MPYSLPLVYALSHQMNQKRYALSIILALCFLNLLAKENSKLFGGGGIGASFGSVTSVQVTPFIGYKVLPKTSVGVSGTYEFHKSNNFSTHIYGGSIFAEQYIGNSFFVRGEYELLSLESAYFDKLEKYPDQERFWHHGILAGAGYSTRVSEHSSFFILAMVNLNQTDNSPYSMPIIKIGFTIH